MTWQMVKTLSSAITPNKDRLETVTITSRRLLSSKLLSFSVEREGLVRSTFISRADFGSLLVSLKLYKKLHPKE